jgi:thioesterase domain-containing protein
LASHFGDDQPVYGIDLPSGRIEDRAQVEIRRLAANALSAVRSVYPSGYFHLSGHSIGALIVFDMARQLAAASEPLGMLALADCDLAQIQTGKRQRVSIASYFRFCTTAVRKVMANGVAETLRRRIKHLSVQSRVRLAKTSQASGAEELLMLRAREYEMLPYPGDAVVLLARDEFRTTGDLGWADVIRGGLEIIEVPGQHMSMLEDPNVGALAAELTARMRHTSCLQSLL